MLQTRTEAQKIPEARRSVLMDAANTLADARRTKNPIAELPSDLRPVNETEAYLVQEELATAFGAVGGWKVGAPSPDGAPSCAPMPQIWTAASGTEFRGLQYRGVEAEIAFQLGKDLPAQSGIYERDQILDAIAGCHPAIEILDSGFEDPTKVDRLCGLADLLLHGGFCFGASFAGWRDLDFSRETVTMSIDGIVRVERTGSNPAGDLIALLVWLANDGSRQTGGLRTGQWITTGSWMGSLRAEVRSAVTVRFTNAGEVALQFAPEQDLEKGFPGFTRRFS